MIKLYLSYVQLSYDFWEVFLSSSENEKKFKLMSFADSLIEAQGVSRLLIREEYADKEYRLGTETIYYADGEGKV